MKPMLAATFKIGEHSMDDLVFPLIGSPKLDGVRAIVSGGTLLSRKLKRIPNIFVHQSLGNLQYEGLDGELICGLSYAKNAFTETTSAVMTHGGEPPVTFFVFDRWDMAKDAYVSRIANLPRPIDVAESENGYVRIRKLPTRVLNDEQELWAYEQACLDKGYEGIMLRHPNGPYKFGRSTMREGWLIKLKRFADSEAVIIGMVEKVTNQNEAVINELGYTKRSSHKANRIPVGTCGALEVRDIYSNIVFQIGTGMDDVTRERFWRNPPLNRIIKYRFQPTGVKEKPRFPVFLGLRED